VIVVRQYRRRGRDEGAGRDLWYHDEAAGIAADCPPAEDERRGSAVHPLHLGFDRQAEGRAAHHRRLPRLGGLTHQYVFDYRPGEIYWCTADVGWVTGHSYIVYGPLANGATTLMFEGVPELARRLAASGRWSTSTRSTSSTPPPPPSAR
jgi:acyl-coenzyme A synthetase/AMP-(fatty) acid ligase